MVLVVEVHGYNLNNIQLKLTEEIHCIQQASSRPMLHLAQELDLP